MPINRYSTPLTFYYLNSWLTYAIPAIFYLILLSNCNSPKTNEEQTGKIIIDATIKSQFHRELKDIYTPREEMFISFTTFNSNNLEDSIQNVSGKFAKGKITWTIPTNKAVLVSPPLGIPIILNPGDSIHILYQRDYPTYYGNHAAIALLDSLMFLQDRILKPFRKYSLGVSNLADFLEWNNYLNNLITLQLPVVDFFKNRLTAIEYQYYRASLIGHIESDRLNAFSALYRLSEKGKLKLSTADLIQIWDSTQLKPTRLWLNSLTEYNGSIYHIYSYAKLELCRRARFAINLDELESKEAFLNSFYTHAKSDYKAIVRERLISFILERLGMTEIGVNNSTTQTLLKDYYSQKDYPAFKQWLKSIENKKQEKQHRQEAKNIEKQDEEENAG